VNEFLFFVVGQPSGSFVRRVVQSWERGGEGEKGRKGEREKGNQRRGEGEEENVAFPLFRMFFRSRHAHSPQQQNAQKT